MRKSVISGLFACAIIPVLSTVKAEAAGVDLLNVALIKPGIEQIIDAGDGVLDDSNELTKAVDTDEVAEPVVTHTVVENETLSDIALFYKTTWKLIYDKNINLVDPNIINPGDVIQLPVPDETIEPRELPEPIFVVAETVKSIHKTTAKVAVSKNKTSTEPKKSIPTSSPGNRYTSGYCTWYVKNRRPDLPNSLGNANTWVSRAAALGLSTGSTPVAGAVGQQGNHVVYVDSVNGDGTVTISEMNFKGWNTTSSRTVAASRFQYIY